jgi:hypothetical protein
MRHAGRRTGLRARYEATPTVSCKASAITARLQRSEGDDEEMLRGARGLRRPACLLSVPDGHSYCTCGFHGERTKYEFIFQNTVKHANVNRTWKPRLSAPFRSLQFYTLSSHRREPSLPQVVHRLITPSSPAMIGSSHSTTFALRDSSASGKGFREEPP